MENKADLLLSEMGSLESDQDELVIANANFILRGPRITRVWLPESPGKNRMDKIK